MSIYVTSLTLIAFICSLQGQILDKRFNSVVFSTEDSWFTTDEAFRVAENILLYQKQCGGWDKNIAMHQPLSEEEVDVLLTSKNDNMGCTIDNGATYLQLIFIKRFYPHHPEKKYRQAFIDGLNYILEAQYDNGGWPQFYPLREGYYSHITYNDNAMYNVLTLLQSIFEEGDAYPIPLSKSEQKKAKKAFDAGIQCILNTQYNQNGTRTGWCAQHDEITLLPAKARSYELPSLSGKESADLIALLMSIPNPSQEIQSAVHSSVAWLKTSALTDITANRVYRDGRLINKFVVANAPAGQPIWGRFMDLETNQPYFCDRDGIKKSSIDSIGIERRIGYAWYATEGRKVIKEYDEWLRQNNTKAIPVKQEFVTTEKFTFVVSQAGDGDFTTIQEAIDASKSFPPERVTIFIRNGVYREKVVVHEWNSRLSLIGESQDSTIITYGDHFNQINRGRNSTFHTATLHVAGDDFIAKQLTIINDAGEVGQAIAVSVNANRVKFLHCRLLGHQDTLYITGEGNKQYFKECFISGTTDFIFGSATAYFQGCTIHGKKASYLTAASTPQEIDFGYVFYHCLITAEEDVGQIYLGRPWRPYARTVFLNTDYEASIHPEGWQAWSNKDDLSTTYYAEYDNYGEGAKTDQRVHWSHHLSKEEAAQYTIQNVLNEPDKPLHLKWYLR